MPMPGEPREVARAGSDLAAAGRAHAEVGVAVTATGRRIAAAWLGPAAAAAQRSVGEIGSRAGLGAEVCAGVGPVLSAYATELHAAQQDFARGEAMEAEARAQLAMASPLAATAPAPGPDPTAPATGPAVGGTPEQRQATDEALARIAEARRIMDAAVERERVANEDAARRVRDLCSRLDAMVAEPPDPDDPASRDPASRDPAGTPGTEPVRSSTDGTRPGPPSPAGARTWTAGDIGHAALDVAGLVPVLGEPLDLINAGWYAIDGDYLAAGLSVGAAIPVAGWLFTGGKLGVTGAKLVRDAPGAAAWLKARPSMVPRQAVRKEFTPTQKFPHGELYEWRDPTTGKRVQYHAHSPDPSVGPGSNARSGPTYRIKIGHHFLDGEGERYTEHQLKSSDEAANATHMPYPAGQPYPGVPARRFAAPNPTSFAEGTGDDR